MLLRRVVLPMREVVNTLLRRDLHTVSPAMLPYYQDVYGQNLPFPGDGTRTGFGFQRPNWI